MINEVAILGVRVHAITVSELHNAILTAVLQKKRSIILNVNVMAFNLSLENPWFRKFLNSADIVFCDGAGVILAARMLGHYIPERITYADWIWQLAKFISDNKLTVFFLGGKPGIAEKAAKNLALRFPALRVAGVHHGYFDKTFCSSENEFVKDLIRKTSPDILILGFGMPLQERWLLENWDSLDAKICLTGGAVFDYVSGELRRAPRWMTDHGLEWLGRLLIEPRRLWRRYILGNPRFLWSVLLQKLKLVDYDKPVSRTG